MKHHTFISSLRVFGWLLWFDLQFLWKDFFQNLIDAITWPACIIFVNGYIVQMLGMPADYGAFTAVGMVVIMGSYSAWAGSMEIAADLAGPQTIRYELTLPLPYWMLWLKKGLFLSIKSALFNISPLLLGKLILGDQLSFEYFSLPSFLLIYLVSSLFFGMFALWSTVITKTVESHSRLELRLVGPMFFLNGWAASWAAIYAALPFLGVFIGCLPWIYAYEGCRGAILGPEGYIPLWRCVVMLLFFSVVITAWSLRLFKKRMDCVS